MITNVLGLRCTPPVKELGATDITADRWALLLQYVVVAAAAAAMAASSAEVEH